MGETLSMRMPVAPNTIIEIHAIGETITADAISALMSYLDIAQRDPAHNPPSSHPHERQEHQARPHTR